MVRNKIQKDLAEIILKDFEKLINKDEEFWILFLVVLKKQLKILIEKNQDYCNNTPMREYAIFGSKSFFNDVWKKTLRVKSLFNSENKPNFESIDDNLMDILNYIIFTIIQIYIDGEKIERN